MHQYLIGLGSNMRHHRHGAPERVLAAAVERLGQEATVLATAPIERSAPLGPSRRRYANSAALVEGNASPEAMLALLQAIEQEFGRRRRGQRWSARVLDLDLLLWSGGCWHSDHLTLPHRELRKRKFVLSPLTRIAPHWRDPHTGLKIRHLFTRFAHPNASHRLDPQKTCP